MIAVLVDKTGKFMRGSIGEGDTLRFSPTSLWPTTMFAILLSSGTEWMPLQDVPIRHMCRRDGGLYWLHFSGCHKTKHMLGLVQSRIAHQRLLHVAR